MWGNFYSMGLDCEAVRLAVANFMIVGVAVRVIAQQQCEQMPQKLLGPCFHRQSLTRLACLTNNKARPPPCLEMATFHTYNVICWGFQWAWLAAGKSLNLETCCEEMFSMAILHMMMMCFQQEISTQSRRIYGRGGQSMVVHVQSSFLNPAPLCRHADYLTDLFLLWSLVQCATLIPERFSLACL